MGTDWKIRDATSADSDGLKICMESAYSAYQERMGDERLPPMDVDYLSEIRNYPSWVVESQGKIVGGLNMPFDNDEASISNIAVDPDYQGQGIGGGLLSYAESTATANGFSELRLTTHVLLHENISLYRHLGWMETGRDETRVYMAKKMSHQA